MFSARLLYIIFTLLYFSGLLEILGVDPFYIKLSIEFFVLLLFANTVFHGKGITHWHAPGLFLFFGYLAFSFFSALQNDSSLYLTYLYFRHILYAYIIMLCVWNQPLPLKETVSLNKFIIWLFLIQLFSSIYKLFFLHARWEYIVGTVTASGGGIATVLPIFGLGYAIAFYIYYRRQLYYLIVGFSLTIIGLASGKRAIFYFIPLLVSFGYSLYIYIENKLTTFNIRLLVLIIILTSFSVFYGVTHTAALNPEGQFSGGSFDPKYMLNYSMEYSADQARGYTLGRLSTTMRVIKSLSGKYSDRWWCGWGPHILYGKSTSMKELKIIYGITGLCRDLISVGYISMIFCVLFYTNYGIKLLRYVKKENDPYFKALAFGTLLATGVFYLDYFTYYSSFTASGVLSFTYFYFAATTLSPFRDAPANI